MRNDMTPQEKLTKIESVIRECCPELQELSFGCKVLHKSSGDIRQVVSESVAGVCINTPRTGIVNYNQCFGKEFEIIGHPIHLEHILRAIYRTGKADISLDYSALVPCMIFNEILHTRFDLTLPFHSQSDEFISWLYGVLE